MCCVLKTRRTRPQCILHADTAVMFLCCLQCWRYERMTRGRRREHYQWNMDIVGVPGECRQSDRACKSCLNFLPSSLNRTTPDAFEVICRPPYLHTPHIHVYSPATQSITPRPCFLPGVEAEAELLSAVTTFFSRVGLTSADVGLKVSSRKVLAAVLERFQVPQENFAQVRVAESEYNSALHWGCRDCILVGKKSSCRA